MKADQNRTLLRYSPSDASEMESRPETQCATTRPTGQRGTFLKWRYSIAAAFGLVAVALMLELFVRFLIMGPGTLFAPEGDIGKVPVNGTYVLWGIEGYGRTQYARDGEIATPSTGGPAVVVLGDSHTEAHQVDDAAKFVSVAETSLRDRGKIVDLHNLGFSSGTIADYVQLGPSIIARFRPIAVVIQLTAADFGPEAFDTTRVNHFVRASKGALAFRHMDTPVDLPSLGARLKHASALVNYSHMRYLTIAERTAHKPTTNRDGNTAFAVRDRDTISAQLELLHHAYAATPVILLILPSVPRIQSGGIAIVDPAHEELLQAIQSSLRGATASWRIVDPSPGFRQLAESGELPRGFLNTRPGSGHLNASGHRIVGEVLANAITSILP